MRSQRVRRKEAIRPSRVRGEDWLALDTEITRSEDAHRQVTERDLADPTHEQVAHAAAELFSADTGQAEVTGPLPQQGAEPEVPGLAPDLDWTHVPSQQATDQAMHRAHRALADLTGIDSLLNQGPTAEQDDHHALEPTDRWVIRRICGSCPLSAPGRRRTGPAPGTPTRNSLTSTGWRSQHSSSQ